MLGFCTSYLIGTTGEKMAARLRKHVYDHMQLLPISYFQSRHAGLLLLLWLGIRHVVIHEITPGDLVSLLLYAMLMTSPLSGIAGVWLRCSVTNPDTSRHICPKIVNGWF